MTPRGAATAYPGPDAMLLRPQAALPRPPEHTYVKAAGHLELEVRSNGSANHIARDHQSGCLKARSLRQSPDGELTIALINTAGGITGGDDLTQIVRWHDRSKACLTTPAAEKVYRSAGGNARVTTQLHVGESASAEWLPQEAILFDGGRLDRTLEIHLDSTASLIACDGVVFGRLARGERLGAGYYADTLKVWRAGRLVLFDRTEVDGTIHQWLDGASTGRGHRASGMVLIAETDPGPMLTLIREALERERAVSGASLVRGLIHVRLLASDDSELRRLMTGVLDVARSGRALPRNWSC